MAGYREGFLSVDVPLPQFSPKLSANILRSDRLRDQIFADYDNYTVVTNLVRRAPVFAALNIHQTQGLYPRQAHRVGLSAEQRLLPQEPLGQRAHGASRGSRMGGIYCGRAGEVERDILLQQRRTAE